MQRECGGSVGSAEWQSIDLESAAELPSGIWRCQERICICRRQCRSEQRMAAGGDMDGIGGTERGLGDAYLGHWLSADICDNGVGPRGSGGHQHGVCVGQQWFHCHIGMLPSAATWLYEFAVPMEQPGHGIPSIDGGFGRGTVE